MRALAGLVLLLVLAALAVGAFPVSIMRGFVERRISAEYGAPVHIGAIERDSLFSYNPLVSARDVRIGQPGWAGPGDFVRIDAVRVRVPVIDLLRGAGLKPDTVHISGLVVALIRRADGRNNWSTDEKPDEDVDGGSSLSKLVVEDSRFTLRDEKRRLSLSGTISANARDGVVVAASGRFKGAPATVFARGARIAGVDASAPWPFEATLASPILRLRAKGRMAGAFNTRDMTLSIAARGDDLKHADSIIEAGLFGTQPIDLAADVRHKGRDWFIDRLTGSIGRSRLVGRATVLKRDERTRIDATIRSTQFDFDDLASDAGLAAAAAKRARIGERVIPDTRINLSKMGPTDGVLRFSARRLLFKNDSVFRSLAGVLRLDRRDLHIDNIVAGMTSGRMSGSGRIDSRGPTPVFSADLRFEGASLERLIGSGDDITGRVRGRVRLSGRGDTLREALSRANGKAAMVATDGSVKSTIAHLLGQDLGGAIGQAIGGGEAYVPLRCLVADFQASIGVLTPSPLAIDTGVSIGRGSGRIVMDGEAIALTLAGATKRDGRLRLDGPIRVGGTLTSPRVTVAGLGSTEKPRAAGVIKLLGRSIGAALGIRKDAPRPPQPAYRNLDCTRLIAAALN